MMLQNVKKIKGAADKTELKELRVSNALLPPANEIWGKVVFSQASVCPRGCVYPSMQWTGEVCTPCTDTPRQTPPLGRHPIPR